MEPNSTPVVKDTPTEQLSPDQITAAAISAAEDAAQGKAKEISDRKGGVKVTPVVFKVVDFDDPIVGFYTEPNRLTKVRASDASANQGPVTAGSILYASSFLEDESDPRIKTDDRLYMGACYAMLNVLQIAVDQYKKK